MFVPSFPFLKETVILDNAADKVRASLLSMRDGRFKTNISWKPRVLLTDMVSGDWASEWRGDIPPWSFEGVGVMSS